MSNKAGGSRFSFAEHVIVCGGERGGKWKPLSLSNGKMIMVAPQIGILQTVAI